MLVEKINKWTAVIQASLDKKNVESVKAELDKFFKFIQGYQHLVKRTKFGVIESSRSLEHAEKKESYEKNEIAYCERIEKALFNIAQAVGLCLSKNNLKEISATFKKNVLPAIYENEKVINDVAPHLNYSIKRDIESARNMIKRAYKSIQFLEEIEKEI